MHMYGIFFSDLQFPNALFRLAIKKCVYIYNDNVFNFCLIKTNQKNKFKHRETIMHKKLPGIFKKTGSFSPPKGNEKLDEKPKRTGKTEVSR